MKFDEWISQVVVRLAELIAVNGMTMVVSGQVGQSVPSDANRYGRLGLSIDEAFELTYMRGWFDCLAVGQTDSFMREVGARIGREIAGIQILIPTPEEKEVLLGQRR